MPHEQIYPKLELFSETSIGSALAGSARDLPPAIVSGEHNTNVTVLVKKSENCQFRQLDCGEPDAS